MNETLRTYSNRFKSFPLISHPWMQTIAADSLSAAFHKDMVNIDYHVRLQNDDQLLISIDSPILSTNKVIILFPGLSGTSDSPYIQRIAKKLASIGFSVVRVNYRSCGRGLGLAKTCFHAGLSDDIAEVVRFVREKFPTEELYLLGFSMGGNLLLKMLGEQPQNSFNINKSLAISPPANMASSAATIEKRGKVFSKLFAKRMIQFLKKVQPYTDSICFKNEKKVNGMIDFDEYFTAPIFGFKDAYHYYEETESLNLLKNIQGDCSILVANDDPIVDYNSFDNPITLGKVQLYLTQGGGHIGFLGYSSKVESPFWMDRFILKWLCI